MVKESHWRIPGWSKGAPTGAGNAGERNKEAPMSPADSMSIAKAIV